MVTTVSLLGHIPVAWAIIEGRAVIGALLLAFFSMLDALDGALARVQKSASLGGMLYDAVSDRLKEIVVFSALAVYTYQYISVAHAWVVVAACGTSILVSFVKAKGEVVLSGHTNDTQALNRTFGVGIASYQSRVVALVVGLLFGWLLFILPLLIAANLITASQRFIAIQRALQAREDSR
jgi:CDP-diacylglycerol--glycerol-3-phosphate 3-phosphatidyltransferase